MVGFGHPNTDGSLKCRCIYRRLGIIQVTHICGVLCVEVVLPGPVQRNCHKDEVEGRKDVFVRWWWRVLGYVEVKASHREKRPILTVSGIDAVLLIVDRDLVTKVLEKWEVV